MKLQQQQPYRQSYNGSRFYFGKNIIRDQFNISGVNITFVKVIAVTMTFTWEKTPFIFFPIQRLLEYLWSDLKTVFPLELCTMYILTFLSIYIYTLYENKLYIYSHVMFTKM